MADVQGARPAARALIVTADDFGLHARVNAGIERAHRDGVLAAASLMVGAPAAQDAVARAAVAVARGRPAPGARRRRGHAAAA